MRGYRLLQAHHTTAMRWWLGLDRNKRMRAYCVVAAAVSAAVLLLLLLLHTPDTHAFMLPSPWGYRCEEEQCVRQRTNGVVGLVTLNECKLTCGPAGVLWPRPTSATLGKHVVQFMPSHVVLVPSCADPAVCSLLQRAFAIFRDRLEHYHPKYSNGRAPWTKPWRPATSKHTLTVHVRVAGGESRLSLSTDESYHLVMHTEGSDTTATISAATFFGARHGLETLAQLVEYQEAGDSLMILTNATIDDTPAFAYRGLLLDTSRNFISVQAIERTLDLMAANKLNTFHWHITDTHSFPLYLETLPDMTYHGAYSSHQVYFPTDVRHLLDYARVRGIRVLPEFDAPAHVGNGWQWGEEQGLGKLAVCVNQEPWQEYCVEPPCGQLNLANPNMYLVLAKVFNAMLELFQPIDMFHYGGDEVNLNCWNSTEEIVFWMTTNHLGLAPDAYYKQWSIFQEKARQLLTKANGGVEVPGVLWTSALTEEGNVDRYLDQKKYIIQVWTMGNDTLIAELLTKGYQLIFSNYDAWYLDCGMGAWVGEGNNWCSPYKGWQAVYDNSPHAIAYNLTLSTHLNLILGGEAALWTEQVDDANLDAKLWPRGAALAERLWTNPITNWEAAELRLIHHRQRLVQLGAQAERIQPQWCHQNEGLCYYK